MACKAAASKRIQPYLLNKLPARLRSIQRFVCIPKRIKYHEFFLQTTFDCFWTGNIDVCEILPAICCFFVPPWFDLHDLVDSNDDLRLIRFVVRVLLQELQELHFSPLPFQNLILPPTHVEHDPPGHGVESVEFGGVFEFRLFSFVVETQAHRWSFGLPHGFFLRHIRTAYPATISVSNGGQAVAPLWCVDKPYCHHYGVHDSVRPFVQEPGRQEFGTCGFGRSHPWPGGCTRRVQGIFFGVLPKATEPENQLSKA